jgi:hypothetical protein
MLRPASLPFNPAAPYQTTGYSSTGYGNINGAALVADNPTTFIPCSHATSTANSAPGISGWCWIDNPSASAVHQWTCDLAYQNGLAGRISSGGFWNTSAVVTGFQVDFSTNHPASGVIKIYGIQ